MAKFSRIFHSIEAVEHSPQNILKGTPQMYIDGLNLRNGEFDLPTICSVRDKNGGTTFLSREEWDTTLDEDMACTFITYPREVATIAIVISIISIVVGVITAAKYNGSTKPKLAIKQTPGEKKPTYSFDDQKNSFRLGEPVPVQYGNLRSYPDLAAKTYTEFNSNDEFLYLLMCIGVGSFDIADEDIAIDDTPIANFADVDFNLLPPGTEPELFPTTVETSPDVSGIELGNDFSGPFTATALGFVANRIDFDLTFPAGLTDNGGDESVTVIGDVRRIDENGDPIGGFINVFNEIITDNTTQPIRITFNYFVPSGEEGRYEARARREGETSILVGVNDRVDWTGLRAYSAAGHPDYGDRTLLEVKIRATSQLNADNIGIFNVTGTRKINVWNGATFDFVTSRSVVWAWYDLLTNGDYGAGLDPNTRVDIDTLFALSQQFDAAGFECNIRLENSMSAMDGLSQIAQAARCQVYQKAGQVWLVRDEPNPIVTAFFTHANIVANSLTVTWEMPSELSANYFTVTYLDEETRQEEEVISALFGTVLDISEEVTLYGVTNRQKAWEEGMFFAAQDRFRRKVIEFETDIEGYLPDFLDSISISHQSLVDFTNGFVQDYNAPILELSEPPDFKGKEFGFISLKGKDGRERGPFPCVPGDTPYKVQIACFDEFDEPLTKQIDEPGQEATTFSFGPDTASERAVVISIVPAGEGRVRIKAVNDDPRVHTSAVGNAPERGATFDTSIVG